MKRLIFQKMTIFFVFLLGFQTYAFAYEKCDQGRGDLYHGSYSFKQDMLKKFEPKGVSDHVLDEYLVSDYFFHLQPC